MAATETKTPLLTREQTPQLNPILLAARLPSIHEKVPVGTSAIVLIDGASRLTQDLKIQRFFPATPFIETETPLNGEIARGIAALPNIEVEGLVPVYLGYSSDALEVAKEVQRAGKLPVRHAIALVGNDEFSSNVYKNGLTVYSAVDIRELYGIPEDSAKDKMTDLAASSEGIRFGDFTLKSGVKSPYKLLLKEADVTPGSYPELAKYMCEAMTESILRVRGREYFKTIHYVLGLPNAGNALAKVFGEMNGIEQLKVKKIGEGAERRITGELDKNINPNSKALVIDDVLTFGGSFSELCEATMGKFIVDHFAVAVDREQAGIARLNSLGFTYITAAQTVSEMYSRLAYTKHPNFPLGRIRELREYQKKSEAENLEKLKIYQ